MKQLVALAIIGLLGIAALTAPAPRPTQTTVTIVTTTVHGPTTAEKFSSCPWATATDDDETYFGLLVTVQADATLTFPFSGEIRATVSETLPGPAATSIRLGQYLAQGLAPAVVEFSAEPAAASTLVDGPRGIAGSVCPSSTPKVWHLPGASTRPGEQLRLQLFNPFPEDATVTIRAHSEFGPEPGEGLESISIQSRAWKVIDLDVTLAGRERLALSIDVEQGNVIPSLALTSKEGRQALWPGLGQGSVWHFPLAGKEQLPSALFIANDGVIEVAYTVDVLTEEGPIFGAATGAIAPLTQEVVPLADLAEPPFGVRLTTEGGPVAAVVRAEGDGGLAITPGATVLAQQWLLPGIGAKPDGGYRIWLLNPGTTSLTVTLGALDAGGFTGAPDKVSVPPGGIRTVPVDAFRVFGFVVEAAEPFAAGWSVLANGDAAYVSGVPVVVHP